MLDELGNLQSEGHGINSFATLLSIGLGQEQQFTIILRLYNNYVMYTGILLIRLYKVIRQISYSLNQQTKR